MENKQTAVKWVFNKLTMLNVIDETKYEIFRQLELEAKEMEKEQIKSDFHNSVVAMAMGRIMTPEQYYNETYGN